MAAMVAQGRGAAQDSPSKSVFELVVMKHVVQGYGTGYESVAAGTAFFIAPDGTALTSSHIVGPLQQDRVTYRLLAIVGNEFYSARLICASPLPAETAGRTVLSRDVAEIRLVPSEFGVDQFSYRGVVLARPHRGPLPTFPALALAAVPAIGDAVRVLGFGRRNAAILPSEWSAAGAVDRLWNASDGTPVFSIKFAREAEPGHSGSPVLNARDQVVGVFTWFEASDHTVGLAISRAALDPACP